MSHSGNVASIVSRRAELGQLGDLIKPPIVHPIHHEAPIHRNPGQAVRIRLPPHNRAHTVTRRRQAPASREPPRCHIGPVPRARRKITRRYLCRLLGRVRGTMGVWCHVRGHRGPAPASGRRSGYGGSPAGPVALRAHHQFRDRGPGARSGPHRCHIGPVITGPMPHWCGSRAPGRTVPVMRVLRGMRI